MKTENIKITVISFRSSLKKPWFFGFMFNIHDLQYWAKALRQFCSPALDRDSIIKSSAYKRELNFVPLGKTKGPDKIFSKE